MASRLVLVRHGHSIAQEQKIVSGEAACAGLPDLGRRQFHALADRLVRTGELGDVTSVYTSPFARSAETAQVLTSALGTELREGDPRFSEVSEPAFDGQRYVSRLRLWRTVGFHRPSSEGAESYEAFVRRAADRLCSVVEEHPEETTIVVTHVGVVRDAMWTFGAARLGSGFFLTMRNASLTEFIRRFGFHGGVIGVVVASWSQFGWPAQSRTRSR